MPSRVPLMCGRVHLNNGYLPPPPALSPVAVHDGHAEGSKGIARCRLDVVQQVKQRRALQRQRQTDER